MTANRLILLVLNTVIAVYTVAQGITENDGDEFVRLNPEIEFSADCDDDIISIPEYLNPEPLIMNGADWSSLNRAINSNAITHILHIGDSHMQADIATDIVRSHLQYDFGNAGRGLVLPLRLSGTNEPYNYSFKSDIPWKPMQFAKQSRSPEMGFTGCTLSANNPDGWIELSTNGKDDYNPFSLIQLFANQEIDIFTVTDEDSMIIGFTPIHKSGYTNIHLSRSTRYAKIRIKASGTLDLYGASLLSKTPGITYDVIGHNGATFASYNRLAALPYGIKTLNPSLIIISLGCNEAFGKIDWLTLTNDIDRLITDLKRQLPGAVFLLTTPMECQKKRTVIAKVRDIILTYGKNKHIAVYDFYNVAGGAGASGKWIADNLFSRDRIHLSAKGYHLFGKMLYNALANQMTQK